MSRLRFGNFFIEIISETTAGRERSINSILGKLRITEKQASKLEVKAYSQWSPICGEVLFTV